MPSIEHYDAVIIGSGQAGGPLSTALVEAGRKTVLVERDEIGGTCINIGCTPTKTMIASAQVAYLARRASDYGVQTGSVSVDMGAVLRRKREMVERFRHGSRQAIKAGGVEIVKGEASFVSTREVRVTGGDGTERRIKAGLIVIDTGTQPSRPPVPGIETFPTLDSTTVMEVDRLPSHLMILGGSYIGVEFAQLFRRLGSRVTVLEVAPSLVANEDSDVSEALEGILREDAIEIFVGTHVTKVEVDGSGEVGLSFQLNGSKKQLRGSHLLAAAGRKPNTESLDLPAAGVEIDDHGFIKVNERLETTAPDIYAVGDVVGGPAFTHISYDDFRILRDNLLHGGSRTTKDRLVPYTVFTDPELARVGMSERQARDRGLDFAVAKIPMSSVARALEVDQSRGFIKAVVDRQTQQILGCAVLGIEGGEIMAMVEIAMMGKLPYTKLREGIFAHPTLAEGVNVLFSSLE